jgi:hypothetical protein
LSRHVSRILRSPMCGRPTCSGCTNVGRPPKIARSDAAAFTLLSDDTLTRWRIDRAHSGRGARCIHHYIRQITRGAATAHLEARTEGAPGAEALRRGPHQPSLCKPAPAPHPAVGCDRRRHVQEQMRRQSQASAVRGSPMRRSQRCIAGYLQLAPVLDFEVQLPVRHELVQSNTGFPARCARAGRARIIPHTISGKGGRSSSTRRSARVR